MMPATNENYREPGRLTSRIFRALLMITLLAAIICMATSFGSLTFSNNTLPHSVRIAFIVIAGVALFLSFDIFLFYVAQIYFDILAIILDIIGMLGMIAISVAAANAARQVMIDSSFPDYVPGKGLIPAAAALGALSSLFYIPLIFNGGRRLFDY